MTTACTITVADGFGTAASLFRGERGYPDGRDGVLNTLRVALDGDTETRPDRFDPRAFRSSLWDIWSAQGLSVSAIPSPVDFDRRPTAFHYDVLPTNHFDPTLFVRVSALEEPRGGIGPRAFLPVAGFLLFPTRVRAVELSQADLLAAHGRNTFAGLLARVVEAREGARPMLGELGASEAAGRACLSLGAWLVAGERADQEAVAAFHERGVRAIRRAGRSGRRVRA
jgi:hypothetical protein